MLSFHRTHSHQVRRSPCPCDHFPLIATGTTTGSDTLYVTITGYTTIYSDIGALPTPQTFLYPYATFYYSPGICPSGYTYAIPCINPPCPPPTKYGYGIMPLTYEQDTDDGFSTATGTSAY